VVLLLLQADSVPCSHHHVRNTRPPRMLKVIGASWFQTRVSTCIVGVVSALGILAVILGELDRYVYFPALHWFHVYGTISQFYQTLYDAEGPRNGLDDIKRKKSLPPPRPELQSLAAQSVVSLYTDCALATHTLGRYEWTRWIIPPSEPMENHGPQVRPWRNATARLLVRA
jgi:hypothetical protein